MKRHQLILAAGTLVLAAILIVPKLSSATDIMNGDFGQAALSTIGTDNSSTNKSKGTSTITGTVNDDDLTGSNGKDIIFGRDGNDTINGGSGKDTVNGESGDDTLNGDSGPDTLNGGSGDDTLNGGSDNDTLTGGDGSDTFFFSPGSGTDTITDFKQGENDKIDLTDVPGVTNFTDLMNSSTQSGSDTIIDLGNGNTLTLKGVQKDSLTGSGFALPQPVNQAPEGVTFTDDQHQTITSASINESTPTPIDQLVAFITIQDDGFGTNQLSLTGEDSTYFSIGNNNELHFVMSDENGQHLSANNKPAYNVTVTPYDTVKGTAPNSSSDFTVNITENKPPWGVTFTDDQHRPITSASINESTPTPIDQLVAFITIQDDGFGTNQLSLTGEDSTYFSIGNNNELHFVMSDENGQHLSANNKPAYNVTVTPYDTVKGTAPNSSSDFTVNITAAGVPGVTIYGTEPDLEIPGNDTLTGGAGDDFIYGLGGNDLLSGLDGNDSILGGGGNDTLNGGSGDDYIYGDSGGDTLIGGLGSDVLNSTDGDGTRNYFVYESIDDSTPTNPDTITNSEGVDVFVLADIDADSNTLGFQAFGFAGKSETEHHPVLNNSVHWWHNVEDNTIIIEADVDGDVTPGPALKIILSDLHDLTANNFIFRNSPPKNLILSPTSTEINYLTVKGTEIKVADIFYIDDEDEYWANTLGLTGTDKAFFTIKPYDGLYFVMPESNTLRSYEVTVTVDDPTVGTIPDSSATFTVNITDAILGTPGDDTNDTFGEPDTSLKGTEADDTIKGLAGHDTLYGLGGNDTLWGGYDYDYLYGGSGNNIFVYESVTDSSGGFPGNDVIYDFQAGVDKIDLSRIDANTGDLGNQAFGGSLDTPGAPYENDEPTPHYSVIWRPISNGVVIEADNNGDGIRDLFIHLPFVERLTAANFIL